MLKKPSFGAILAPDGSVTSEYEDVVEPRRGHSDLYWAAQEWESSGSFPGSEQVPAKEAVERVMASPGLQHIMEQVAEERNVPLRQVKNEARDILNIMGHQQDISAIRKFAFFLAKMVKAMYNKIVVHRPSIEMLRKAIQTCPVVLLPTHRSYADFILVSYLSYHYSLPFPVIAAGMDFYHMTHIGQLLREAGAFYIKRSFVDDVLYWAIFQEYVKLLVCRESAPLEFFLEGTRSRTAKTLRPKLGLLGCICQYSCLDEVSDVLIMPINISYDRTLEEELYAWELLGIPKPKESTSGLFRAKRILKEQYGNVFVHVGKPVSVRAAMQSCNFNPANLHNSLSSQQVIEVDNLALRLVREQMRGAAISVFSMAAHFLLLKLQQNCSEVPYSELLSTVAEVVNSTQDSSLGSCCTALFGGYGSPGDINACLQYALSVHSNLVCLREGKVCFTPLMAMAVSSEMSSDEKQKRVFVLHLMLQHYANQSIHVLVLPALLCAAVAACSRSNDSATLQSYSAPLEIVKPHYVKLIQLFNFEFIPPADPEASMTEAISRICSGGCGVNTDNVLTIKRLSSPSLALLYLSCLNPFLQTYCTAISTAAQREWPDTGALENAIREGIKQLYLPRAFKPSKIAEKNLGQGVCDESSFADCSSMPMGADDLHSLALYSSLSLDTIKNSVRALVKAGAVQSSEAQGGRLVPSRRVLCALFTLVTGDELPFLSRL